MQNNMHSVQNGGVHKVIGTKKYYAVAGGRKTGVFHTWDECKAQVNGYNGAKFKSFSSFAEAEAFVRGGAAPAAYHPLAGTSNAPPPKGHHATVGVVVSAPSHAPRQHTQPVPSHSQRQGSTAGGAQHTHQRGPHASNELAWTNMESARGGGSAAGGARVGLITSSDVGVARSQGAPAPVAVGGSAIDKATRIAAGAEAAGQNVELLPGAQPVNPSIPYFMNFDGASRGNPGKAGAGAIIVVAQTGEEVAHLVYPLPYGSTNNEAEYCGLICGLAAAHALGIRRLTARGDSQLVCNQVEGKWRVNKEHLVPYHAAAQRLAAKFFETRVQPGASAASTGAFTLHYVPRAQNSAADHLSNVAVDMQ